MEVLKTMTFSVAMSLVIATVATILVSASADTFEQWRQRWLGNAQKHRN
jgi:hypothetical protein